MSEDQPSAPSAQPSAPPAQPPSQAVLQAFIAHQTAGFHGWIYAAVRKYNETGVLPAEIFSEAGKLRAEEKGRRHRKPGYVKKPRPMNAFNYFVQQKMNEYKEKGIKAPNDGDNKGLFAMAVNEWKEMTGEARDQFTADFKLSHPPAPPASPEEADAEVHEDEGEEDEAEEDHELESLVIAPLDLPVTQELPIKREERKEKERDAEQENEREKDKEKEKAKKEEKHHQKKKDKVKDEVKVEPERQSKRDRKPKQIEDLGAEPEKKKKSKKA